MSDQLMMAGVYKLTCLDRKGNFKWFTEIRNTIVNSGLQNLLDVVFTGTPAADSTWYLGLTYNDMTVLAADTLAGHAGWTECAAGTVYTQANRPQWTEARSGQKLSNSGNKAVFSIDTTATLGGGFLANTQAGTAGVLFSAGPFSGGDQGVNVGDTINVQYDLSAASV